MKTFTAKQLHATRLAIAELRDWVRQVNISSGIDTDWYSGKLDAYLENIVTNLIGAEVMLEAIENELELANLSPDWEHPISPSAIDTPF